eukprot:9638692-Heterocapsa_arctica.AAC.1
MRCARALMQVNARGHTNEWFRAQLHLPTVASYLPAQRMKWLKSLMRQPLHNATLLAALAGSSVWDELSPLDELGVPRQTANPWLRQFWDDVQMVGSLFPNVLLLSLPLWASFCLFTKNMFLRHAARKPLAASQ